METILALGTAAIKVLRDCSVILLVKGVQLLGFLQHQFLFLLFLLLLFLGIMSYKLAGRRIKS
jgi:hypothetical protein